MNLRIMLLLFVDLNFKAKVFDRAIVEVFDRAILNKVFNRAILKENDLTLWEIAILKENDLTL